MNWTVFRFFWAGIGVFVTIVAWVVLLIFLIGEFEVSSGRIRLMFASFIVLWVLISLGALSVLVSVYS